MITHENDNPFIAFKHRCIGTFEASFLDDKQRRDSFISTVSLNNMTLLHLNQ